MRGFAPRARKTTHRQMGMAGMDFDASARQIHGALTAFAGNPFAVEHPLQQIDGLADPGWLSNRL